MTYNLRQLYTPGEHTPSITGQSPQRSVGWDREKMSEALERRLVERYRKEREAGGPRRPLTHRFWSSDMKTISTITHSNHFR
eukprot:CCRYP_014315-RB/>CCRYP_014315-RB protein AED:0.30 eAED:0.37 QI:4/0/0.5/1/0/0/2/1422/81